MNGVVWISRRLNQVAASVSDHRELNPRDGALGVRGPRRGERATARRLAQYKAEESLDQLLDDIVADVAAQWRGAREGSSEAGGGRQYPRYCENEGRSLLSRVI